MVGILILAARVAADPLPALHDAALDANPRIAAARQKWEAAKAAAGGSGTLADPMVGADAMRSGTTQFSDYESLEYMVQQNLPWPGQFSAARKVARLNAEAEGFAYLEVRRKVMAAVTGAFWDLWQARQAVDVAQDTQRLAARMEATALARYEAGQGMQADVLRAQIERLRMGSELVTMSNEAAVALTKLNALLNSDPATPRDTTDLPALPETAYNLEALQDQARQFCCILMANIRRREAREAAVEAARLERRPMFQVIAKARQFRDTGTIDEYDTGFAVNVPWVWGRKYDAMTKEARAELAMAGADYDMELNETLTDIQMRFTEADAMNRDRRLYENEVVPRTDRLVASTRTAYESGQLPLRELLDALQMRQDALLGWYRATAGYAKAQAELAAIAAPWSDADRATGLMREKP